MIMRKTYKHARRSGPSPVVILLVVLLTVLCVNLAVVVALVRSTPEEPGEPLMEAVTRAPVAPVATEPRETEPVTTMAAEETQPSETAEAPKEREYLPALQEKREENEDTVGWITIEGTKIDYPVMYTPQDPEKYLHLGFDQKYSFAGLPFIDANCSLDPESDNLIIYAHNMLDGSMFRSLMKYEQKSYWQQHPTVKLDLWDEEREYEVLAAFRDRVYYKTENCFKFYKFIDAESEDSYREAIDYYKTHACYDTGVTAQPGDRLLTLVTCAYHTDNGRFVVVAREK